MAEQAQWLSNGRFVALRHLLLRAARLALTVAMLRVYSNVSQAVEELTLHTVEALVAMRSRGSPPVSEVHRVVVAHCAAEHLDDFTAALLRAPADGDCLFHAVATLLCDASTAAELRRRCAEFVDTHASLSFNGDTLAEWINLEYGETVAEYKLRMLAGRWGGQLELAVLSIVTASTVVVCWQPRAGVYRERMRFGNAGRRLFVLYTPFRHYDGLALEGNGVALPTASQAGAVPRIAPASVAPDAGAMSSGVGARSSRRHGNDAAMLTASHTGAVPRTAPASVAPDALRDTRLNCAQKKRAKKQRQRAAKASEAARVEAQMAAARQAADVQVAAGSKRIGDLPSTPRLHKAALAATPDHVCFDEGEQVDVDGSRDDDMQVDSPFATSHLSTRT